MTILENPGRQKVRILAVVLALIALNVAVQAFVFLGELRFKTVVFDFPAIVVSVLGLLVLLQRMTTTLHIRSAPPAHSLRK